jgi:hypothetical protein
MVEQCRFPDSGLAAQEEGAGASLPRVVEDAIDPCGLELPPKQHLSASLRLVAQNLPAQAETGAITVAMNGIPAVFVVKVA